MRLELGVAVTASDGKHVGRVRRLVVDPATSLIPYFVLDRGPFLPQVLVAPDDIAEIEAGGALGLCLDAGQVAALPRYVAQDLVVAESPAMTALDYAIPADGGLLPLEARALGTRATHIGTPFRPGEDALLGARLPMDAVIVARSSLPEQDYPIGRGTEIWTSDNWTLGHVVAVDLADDGHPQALVVGSLFNRPHHRVPFAAIAAGEPQRLVIGATAEQFLRQEAATAHAAEAR